MYFQFFFILIFLTMKGIPNTIINVGSSPFTIKYWVKNKMRRAQMYEEHKKLKTAERKARREKKKKILK